AYHPPVSYPIPRRTVKPHPAGLTAGASSGSVTGSAPVCLLLFKTEGSAPLSGAWAWGGGRPPADTPAAAASPRNSLSAPPSCPEPPGPRGLQRPSSPAQYSPPRSPGRLPPAAYFLPLRRSPPAQRGSFWGQTG